MKSVCVLRYIFVATKTLRMTRFLYRSAARRHGQPVHNSTLGFCKNFLNARLSLLKKPYFCAQKLSTPPVDIHVEMLLAGHHDLYTGFVNFGFQ